MSLVSSLQLLTQAIGQDIASLVARVTALEASNPIVLSSDFTTTSASYVAVPALSAVLAENAIYNFEFRSVYSTSNKSNGVGFAVTGPVSPEYCVHRHLLAYTPTAQTLYNGRGYDLGPLASSMDVANSPLFGLLEGTIKTTEGGTFGLLFRGEVAGSTYRLHAGSSLTLRRLA
jgi:hypothetical protein